MSYSLSGVAISKAYKTSFDLLQKQLDLALELVKEISFEQATSGYMDEGYCGVCFTDSATLLLVAEKRGKDDFYIEDARVLRFALSESKKRYKVAYYEGSEEKRAFDTVEDNVIFDRGDRLTLENETENATEVIWNMLTEVMGEDFDALEEHASCYLYKIVDKEVDKEVDKSLVRQVLIKGKYEYCHLILEPTEKLVFTNDGSITHKKAVVLGKEDGFFKGMKLFTALVLVITIVTYVYVSYYYYLIPLVVFIYLMYSIYMNSNLSTVNSIDKKEVIEVELVKRGYINTIGFDIRFKDGEGKRKVRRFILPNQVVNQDSFYVKAREIFKHNGYMK